MVCFRVSDPFVGCGISGTPTAEFSGWFYRNLKSPLFGMPYGLVRWMQTYLRGFEGWFCSVPEF